MRDDSIRVLKTVKHSAIAVGVLMVAGILTVMVLARGKTGDDGDIAGVVAPALLLTCVSGVVAAVTAVRQKRAQSDDAPVAFVELARWEASPGAPQRIKSRQVAFETSVENRKSLRRHSGPNWWTRLTPVGTV